MPFPREIYTHGIHIPPVEIYTMCDVVSNGILESCGGRIITRRATVNHGRGTTSGRGREAGIEGKRRALCIYMSPTSQTRFSEMSLADPSSHSHLGKIAVHLTR